MKPDDILIALKNLTDCERIEFLPLAPELRKPSAYAPVEKYLHDVKVSKPETAAEDLFTALCKDVLGFQPTRQVVTSDGWVDFVLPEKTGQLIVPFDFELSDKGQLEQTILEETETRSLLTLLNSLVLNFYLRSKISETLNMFYMYELPIPKLSAAQKKKLADFAGKLLKNPRDVKERVLLETFIARELYSLSLDDWKHLTGTFTFGGGESKAELDEIIRQSVALWEK